MSITRAQQAKQMLQNGGRIGLQGGGRDMGRQSQGQSRRGSSTSPGKTSPNRFGRDTGGRDPMKQFEAVRTPNIVDEVALTSSANRNFMRDARDAVTPLGDRLLNKVPFSGGILGGIIRGGLNAFSPSPFGFSRPQAVDLSMDQRDGRGGILPLWAQLGFNSEEEFQAAQRMAQASSNMDQETEDPQGLEGLRLAFRADGGPIGGEYDFESARQMYGLGKLVKKGTRTVKKIAKSPVGKLAIGAAILGTPFGAGAKGTGFFGSKSLFGRGLGFIKGMGVNKALLGTADYQGGATGLSSLFSKIPGGGVTAAIAGTSLLAGLLTPEQEEEAQLLATEQGIDIEAARNSILNAGTSQDFRARGFRAEGGRIGYDEAGAVMSKGEMEKLAKSPLYKGFKKMYNVDPSMAKSNESYKDKFSMFEQLLKKGYQKGGDVEPVAKKTMPLLDMGGKEMDLREEGGFVPIGRMEKADDVPARLSKNEFVFTADAVRNAGDGNVDKGAEVMYNMMKNLEAGGDVSEESQGLKGARRMFQRSQRLEEVLLWLYKPQEHYPHNL